MSTIQSSLQSLQLWAPTLSPNYNGTLFFLLGPGLGDTVNDFRLMHEVLARYPHATPVFYADPRWQDLYASLPELRAHPIRHYREAPSAEQPGKSGSAPFNKTFQSLLEELAAECAAVQGFIALANRRLGDDLARKEPSIARRARTIGLPLTSSQQRPYCPLSEETRKRAGACLDSHHLRPGQYLVVSPHTWPDKMWDHRSWQQLLTRITDSTALSILVIGVPGYPSLRAHRVAEILGAPLSVIAGLIAQAHGYIGLDSGPTHLAACFDLPLVTLNPQGKYPPWLIEPHSPYRWTLLTPGLYGDRPISVESAWETLAVALKQLAPPPCPSCRQSPYVLLARQSMQIYLCRCGLIFRNPPSSQPEEQRLPNPGPGGSVRLPTNMHALARFRQHVKPDEQGNAPAGRTVPLLEFDHWDPIGIAPEVFLSASPDQDLWWTWDAAYRFTVGHGWQVRESALTPIMRQEGPAFSARFRLAPPSSGDGNPIVAVPWGSHVLRMKRSTYENLLSWGTFRKQEELEGLGLFLASEGDSARGLEILRLALQVAPSWRSVRRFVRTKWAALAKSTP